MSSGEDLDICHVLCVFIRYEIILLFISHTSKSTALKFEVVEIDSSDSCTLNKTTTINVYELHQAKRGLMVILKNFVRYISTFDYCEGINRFCANTFENKMFQYFTETYESHVGYFQSWRHILRHLRHLLALCWTSHKPPFRLAQLIYSISTLIIIIILVSNCFVFVSSTRWNYNLCKY